MEVEITPEPSPEERAALLEALKARDEALAEGYRSDWRLAGLLENVDSADLVPPPAPGSPRSSRGASRA